MGFFLNEITRDKFIILYFLTSSELELTNSQITTAILQNQWCDYFSLQQALVFLCDNGLVAQINRPAGLCYCTSEAGKQVVEEFKDRFAQSQKDEIDAFILDHKDKLQLQLQNLSTFEKTGDNEYLVVCKIIEGSASLLEIKINLPERSIAQIIADQWKIRAQDVYGEILKLLG